MDDERIGLVAAYQVFGLSTPGEVPAANLTGVAEAEKTIRSPFVVPILALI